jgi:hypothetical protein
MIVPQPIAAVRLNEMLGLQIVWSKACVLGNTGQHTRTDLLPLVEGEDVIGVAVTRKCAMRTGLSFNLPSDS